MDFMELPELRVSNEEFLRAIFGENAPYAHVTGFPDDPSAITPDRRGICWGGTHYSRANGQLHTPGWNQYFTISLFRPDENGRPVRRKANFVGTYCIVADDVGIKIDPARAKLLPAPSWRMETSPGNEQWGWILDKPETDRARVENLLDGLVALGLSPDGTDPGMKGVTRYARLSEGWNTKAKYGPGTRCKMQEWEPTRRVTLEALAGPFGVDLNARRADQGAQVPARVDQHPALKYVTILSQKGDGQYLIECPWIEEHADGDNSGTILYTNSDRSLGFKCHHGHCQERQVPDLLDKLGCRPEVDTWRAFSGVTVPDGALGDATAAQDAPGPVDFMQIPPQGAGERQAPEKGSLNYARSLISATLPGDAERIDRIISAIAAASLSEASSELLLQDLSAQVAIGIGVLRKQFDSARRKLWEARKRKVAAERQASNGAAGAALLSAEPGVIAYPLPEGDDPNGKGMPHTENLKAMCRHFGIGLWHNLMDHTIEIQIPGATFLDDERKNLQLIALKDIAVASNMTLDRMDQLVLSAACEASYHPFDAWLNTGQWDGVRRFHPLCATVRTPTPDLFARVLAPWMRQAIVAARNQYGSRPPRDVLVFSGEQHCGKTSFFRKLTPPGMFGEGLHMDPRNKDDLVKATNKLVTELGELDATFRKSDIAVLKSFISSPTDSVRLPYAHEPSTWPRRTIFCATVNDEDFLVDSTGNSRFRVISTEGFDLDTLERWVHDGTLWQIWKEVEFDVSQGAPWWLDESTEREMVEHVEKFRRIGAAEQALLDMLDWDAPREKWMRVTTTAIGNMIGLSVGPGGRNGVGAVLARLLKNYTGQKKPGTFRPRDGGKVVKGWEIPPWR